MSQLSLKVARRYGRRLPAFRNLAEAKRQLFAARNAGLARLRRLAKQSDDFVFDQSVESLKTLEQWYYLLRQTNGFDPLNVTRAEFEESMTAYFYDVVVANRPLAKWSVTEHVFTPGRYELGVTDDLLSVVGSRFTGEAGKTRRNKLFREYQRYFGSK